MTEPLRPAALAWEELWAGPDDGLIACWERGRALAAQAPTMTDAAKAGQLVPLPWKGGVDAPLKTGRKFGTLYYLAMWRGIRGEDLDLDTASTETAITCTRFGVQVTFTFDTRKTSGE